MKKVLLVLLMLLMFAGCSSNEVKGGMFAIEEPDVSARMGKDKLARHIATGAEFITGPDSSCLMHMQGLVKKGKGDYTSKAGKPIEFIHVVQILASGL